MLIGAHWCKNRCTVPLGPVLCLSHIEGCDLSRPWGRRRSVKKHENKRSFLHLCSSVPIGAKNHCTVILGPVLRWTYSRLEDILQSNCEFAQTFYVLLQMSYWWWSDQHATYIQPQPLLIWSLPTNIQPHNIFLLPVYYLLTTLLRPSYYLLTTYDLSLPYRCVNINLRPLYDQCGSW